MSKADDKKYENLVFGKVYLCKIRHYKGERTQEIEMLYSPSSDNTWLTADDESELNFDWNVESWKEIK